MQKKKKKKTSPVFVSPDGTMSKKMLFIFPYVADFSLTGRLNSLESEDFVVKQMAFFEKFLELYFGLSEFCPSLLDLVYSFQNCI